MSIDQRTKREVLERLRLTESQLALTSALAQEMLSELKQVEFRWHCGCTYEQTNAGHRAECPKKRIDAVIAKANP